MSGGYALYFRAPETIVALRDAVPGRPVLYQRTPRMFEVPSLASDDSRHERIPKSSAQMDVLIFEDWGLAVPSPKTNIIHTV